MTATPKRSRPARQPTELETAWFKTERALRRLSKHDPDVHVMVWPSGSGLSCQLVYDGEGENNPSHMATASRAVEDLISLLPLVRDGENEIEEGVRAYLLQSGILALSIRNRIGDRAWGDIMLSPDRAEWFIRNRSLEDEPQTEWQAACRERLVRENTFGSNEVIEPGVVWFVHWFEAQGCETIFSCEGHPDGFYVDVVGPPEILEKISGCGLEVKIRQGGLAAGAWNFTLERQPRTREERDLMLEDVSRRLSSLDLAVSQTPSR